MANLTIRKIIDKISNGEIRIPAFQRGFVWEPDKVAFLMDSLYKGFPIGSILLWRTREKLKTERDLGNFKLPDPQKDYPIDYVLDGQQRLTSVFSVFQTELVPQKNDNWRDIYFIIDSDSSIQKSRFIALEDAEVDDNKHFPLNALFDPVKYRKTTSKYDDTIIKKIDVLQEKFKEVTILCDLLETDNKEQVAIVFERINRAGVQLDTFQLLTAWSWSTDFDLQEKISSLEEEIDDFGFGELTAEKDLLLKCFSGVINGDTSPKAILELDGNLVREHFEEIKNGIKTTIDFLQKELNIYSLKFLPYPAMIVSLTKFFASSKKNGHLYTDLQRKQLIKWFWRCNFSRRYTSGVNDAHEADLVSMVKLLGDEKVDISSFKCEISDTFFKNNQFNTNAVNTKTFIAMLASKNPKSFLSGANVDLSETLKKASSKEFHHVFPDKFLERKGYDKSSRYMLANFVFLNNADNQIIKDKDPKDYKTLINPSSLDSILSSALCPPDALDLYYDDFIEKRVEILVQYAKALIY